MRISLKGHSPPKGQLQPLYKISVLTSQVCTSAISYNIMANVEERPEDIQLFVGDNKDRNYVGRSQCQNVNTNVPH